MNPATTSIREKISFARQPPNPHLKSRYIRPLYDKKKIVTQPVQQNSQKQNIL